MVRKIDLNIGFSFLCVYTCVLDDAHSCRVVAGLAPFFGEKEREPTEYTKAGGIGKASKRGRKEGEEREEG